MPQFLSYHYLPDPVPRIDQVIGPVMDYPDHTKKILAQAGLPQNLVDDYGWLRPEAGLGESQAEAGDQSSIAASDEPYQGKIYDLFEE